MSDFNTTINAIEESMLFAHRKIERLEREKSALKRQLEETEIDLYREIESCNLHQERIDVLEKQLYVKNDDTLSIVKDEYKRMLKLVPIISRFVSHSLPLTQLIAVAIMRDIPYDGLSAKELVKKINDSVD